MVFTPVIHVNKYMDYYLFADHEVWTVELACSWLIHSGQFNHKVVIYQPQIGNRSRIDRRPKDNVLTIELRRLSNPSCLSIQQADDHKHHESKKTQANQHFIDVLLWLRRATAGWKVEMVRTDVRRIALTCRSYSDFQFLDPQFDTSWSYRTTGTGPVLHGVSVYPAAYAGTELYRLASEANVCERLARGHIWIWSGWEWNPRSPVASPTS